VEVGRPIVAEAVRNVVIGTLLEHTSARIVRDGEAEIVIEGTVTMLRGGSEKGGGGFGVIGVVAGGSTSHQGSAGDWISGVTALALRSGALVTSASFGQKLEGNNPLLPAETVAAEFADRLVGALRSKGLPR
jgi:hypothetical protein